MYFGAILMVSLMKKSMDAEIMYFGAMIINPIRILPYRTAKRVACCGGLADVSLSEIIHPAISDWRVFHFL